MTTITAQAIADWSEPSQPTSLSFNEATHSLHAFGPRARFVKLLPENSTLLDAGAGEGSLLQLRDWPAPARSDVSMYAWAGERGAGFDHYAGSEVGMWPDVPPDFGGMQFDAIFSANFLEHIDDPLHFVSWAAGRLTPRGRLYLEWPRPQSLALPTLTELAAVDVSVTTGRYDDDGTHRTVPPDRAAVVAELASCGLSVVEAGIARVPYIDQQLAIHARRSGDITSMTLAYWSHTGWCQYLVAEAAGS